MASWIRSCAKAWPRKTCERSSSAQGSARSSVRQPSTLDANTTEKSCAAMAAQRASRAAIGDSCPMRRSMRARSDDVTGRRAGHGAVAAAPSWASQALTVSSRYKGLPPACRDNDGAAASPPRCAMPSESTSSRVCARVRGASGTATFGAWASRSSRTCCPTAETSPGRAVTSQLCRPLTSTCCSSSMLASSAKCRSSKTMPSTARASLPKAASTALKNRTCSAAPGGAPASPSSGRRRASSARSGGSRARSAHAGKVRSRRENEV